MKRIVPIVLFLLVASLFSYAQSGKPSMTIDQMKFDAGQVWRNGKPIEHAFRIKNTGSADLNILEVKPG